MSTPYNAPYKKANRARKKAIKNRGEVLWVSCHLVNIGTPEFPEWVKRPIQGTAYSDGKGGYCSGN